MMPQLVEMGCKEGMQMGDLHLRGLDAGGARGGTCSERRVHGNGRSIGQTFCGGHSQV